MAKEPGDSGMASFDEIDSKDATPEKPKSIVADDSDDEDIEETMTERLVGLTEMFPEPLVKFTSSVTRLASSAVVGFFNLSKACVWVAASSSIVLFGPLVLEVERAQLEESQRSQQKQFLLGPNAMSGGLGPNVAMAPR